MNQGVWECNINRLYAFGTSNSSIMITYINNDDNDNGNGNGNGNGNCNFNGNAND